MAIYRGSGGSTSTTDQATIDQVAEDAATATTKAAEAATSASSASSSASSASTSATNAASSASSASSSASSASTSASNASSSASSASSSATAAAASATSASGSATNAASEAAAALASKGLAVDAQTAAETAESNASDHASDAVKAAYGAVDTLQTLSDSSTIYSARHYASKTGADVTAAAASAAAAATSETNAASSASAAQAAEDAALAALDSFDDRYLGQKASDPTTDNDGDALVAGALYYNTTDTIMKVFDGSVWVAAYASLSGTLVAANNLSDVSSVSAARTNLGLGTAATTASTDYATAAQGALADSALQDITGESIEDLLDVATMTPTDGQLLTWDSVTSKWNAEDAPVSLPDQTGQSGKYLTTNGTSASWGTVDTSQGDTAYSWGDHALAGYELTSNLGTAAYTASTAYATAAQGSNADTAYGWGDHSTQNYATTTGDTMTGALNFGDNVKAQFGASNDLQIYHSGTASYITDAGTGDLNINGQNVAIRKTDGTNLIYTDGTSGVVTLRYNGTTKLSTVSAGIDVSGQIQINNGSDRAIVVNTTSDGSDTGDFIACGGGSASSSRGGYFRAFGNEHSTNAGQIAINTGAVAGSRASFTIGNGAENFRMESDGDFHADGDVIAYSTTISDERLKENIVGIDGALGKVAQLNGYTFTYKADGKISAGVIAQEVEKVLPEAVSEKELPLKADDGEQYKVVNYDALHGLLIEAVKELKSEVEALKAAK